jgi:hypothetical protein
MRLAALSIIGLSDIHQMNGLKNVLALCVNGVAALPSSGTEWSTGPTSS